MPKSGWEHAEHRHLLAIAKAVEEWAWLYVGGPETMNHSERRIFDAFSRYKAWKGSGGQRRTNTDTSTT